MSVKVPLSCSKFWGSSRYTLAFERFLSRSEGEEIQGELNLTGEARKHVLAPVGSGEYKEQLLLLGVAG